MADDGTQWSHTSGEAEELNIVSSSGKNTKKDREVRKKKREQREKENQEAKEKDIKEEGGKEKDAK
ncbi:hypothetical protein VE01_09988 [Pseudogymnoascus verrucosus]|uniref:Uncharacterized protein n=1 Tax=Pseudogymnoascus verrucosus TaxID=342668 RepID=A0A1B8G8P0_9PEZI|nr:uncharacterized protein VE01_09988 [Pseudogymnoascus verrucosus]OBT92203.1 hypothetical protein VE01_09988 [Pseudogymnoascus verrucosus]